MVIVGTSFYSVRDYVCNVHTCGIICFFQAEDGIRYLVRSRGLGDVYKRQVDKLSLLFLFFCLWPDNKKVKNKQDTCK